MSRAVFGILFTLLLIGTLMFRVNIRPALAQSLVYINADGSVSPSGAPISTVDNVTYTFTGNMTYPTYDGVVVERNNIVIDGNRYTLQGNQSLARIIWTQNLTNPGLSLMSINNVTIKNVSVNGFQVGVYLNSSNNNTVSWNDVAGNSVDGICLEDSSNNTVSLNNATGNGYDGIGVCYSSNGNIVSSNNSTANGDDGVSLTNYLPFYDQYYGIFYPGSSNNIVSGNNATANSLYGIHISGSSNNTVSGNNATGNFDGIHLEDVSNSNVLSSNNSTSNYNGIYIDSSSNNTVRRNNAETNSNNGIYLINSSGNVLSNNVMQNNNADNFGVLGWIYELNVDEYVNYIDTSNLVNGKPVYYMMDKSNLVINPQNYPDIGYLALINCTNMTVQGLSLSYSHDSQGILLAGTNYSKIADNNITNNDDGISLYYSLNNTISGNTATANSVGIHISDSSDSNTVNGNNASANSYGLDLDFCSNNTFCGNEVTANQGSGIGIGSLDLENSSNIFSGNYIASNGQGIYFIYSEGRNIVSGNNITANSVGIEFYESFLNSKIFHNNFVGNSAQIEIDQNSLTQPRTWDDGYPSGGNYWSDYNGTDSSSGPYQNVSGSDGIGDAPYVLDSFDVDHFPLMGECSEFNIAKGVDVQIISNSKISNFHVNGAAILFNVSNLNETAGFCNVGVSTSLLNGTLFVLVNGTEVQYSQLPSLNANQTYIYFTYPQSNVQITMVPEFPTSLITAIFMLTTLLAMADYKKKRRRPRHVEPGLAR